MLRVTFFAGKSQAFFYAVCAKAVRQNTITFQLEDGTTATIRRTNLISVEEENDD